MGGYLPFQQAKVRAATSSGWRRVVRATLVVTSLGSAMAKALFEARRPCALRLPIQVCRISHPGGRVKRWESRST